MTQPISLKPPTPLFQLERGVLIFKILLDELAIMSEATKVVLATGIATLILGISIAAYVLVV